MDIVLKNNRVDPGYYIARTSSSASCNNNLHIFYSEDEMEPEIMSFCGQKTYREISENCLKKKVDNPLSFIDDNSRFCTVCLNKYRRRHM